MTQETGFVTIRVDFSYDESKYDKEQALQMLIEDDLESTEEIQIDHKEVQVSIV